MTACRNLTRAVVFIQIFIKEVVTGRFHLHISFVTFQLPLLLSRLRKLICVIGCFLPINPFFILFYR